MGSFGERLRREREMRGIGLDEIANATKISARNLRALEEEKFNLLPGGIFNKGFVRAYAKFLGIDEEHIVAEYEAAARETEDAREKKLQEDFSKAEFRPRKDEQEISLEPKSQWGTIAIIVLIAALAYGGYNYYQRRKLDRQQQAQTPPQLVTPPPVAQQPPPDANTSQETSTAEVPGASASSASEPSTTAPEQTKGQEKTKTEAPKPATQKSEAAPPVGAPTSASSQSATLASNAPIELRIKVNQESWVSVRADGRTLVSTTLAAGTERSFRASDKIEMVLGNAGGVEVSYNGKAVENVSDGKDVRRLTFTPTGYQ